MALRSRGRGRPSPNIFSRRLEPPRKPRTAFGTGSSGEHGLSRQGGTAGFYGRAEGVGVGILDLALGMSAPELAARSSRALRCGLPSRLDLPSTIRRPCRRPRSNCGHTRMTRPPRSRRRCLRRPQTRRNCSEAGKTASPERPDFVGFRGITGTNRASACDGRGRLRMLRSRAAARWIERSGFDVGLRLRQTTLQPERLRVRTPAGRPNQFSTVVAKDTNRLSEVIRSAGSLRGPTPTSGRPG